MKIEEGKRYVRRDGLVTGIIQRDRECDDVAFDPTHGGYVFFETGRLSNTEAHDPSDLVVEYTDLAVTTMKIGASQIIAAENIKQNVTVDLNERYGPVQRVLQAALAQTSEGKGAKRHANDKPFLEQRIMSIARQTGVGGHSYQVCKKVQEAGDMSNRGEHDAAKHEILGAIVYCAAMYLLIEEKQ